MSVPGPSRSSSSKFSAKNLRLLGRGYRVTQNLEIGKKIFNDLLIWNVLEYKKNPNYLILKSSNELIILNITNI